MSSTYKKRPCGPVPSAKNPNAYTKEELVSLAVKVLKVTDSKAKSMTKSTICKSLVAGKVVEQTTPVAKRKAPVDSKKRAVSPKKTVKPKTKKSPKSPESKKQAEKIRKPSAEAKVKGSDKTVGLSGRGSPVLIKKILSPKIKVKDKPRRSCIEASKLPLKEHQIKVVNHIRNPKNRGLIVCHDVGSGKTLTAVTAAQCFLEDAAKLNRKAKIIVVTPVSLQDNFKKEMKTYGVGKRDAGKYEFHTLQKFATEYNKKACGSGSKDSKGEMVMLIIDEAHNLRTNIKKAKSSAARRVKSAISAKPKSGKSKAKAKPAKASVVRADVAVRCAKTADKVLLLTATSVYNEPLDLANLVAMVKGENPLTEKAFDKMITNSVAFKNYFGCMVSFFDVPKGEDTGYPTVTENYVEIPMTKSYYKEYRKVEQRNSHLFSEANPWKFLTGVRQASNALEESLKASWVLKRAIKNIKEGKKMLIYSAFKSFGVEKIQEMFVAAGIPYVEITGEIKKEDRTLAVKKYNEGKVKVLFVTKAGGEGLDLKETREVFIFESSWNRASEVQIIGRAARFGSHTKLPKKDRTVDVYHVLMVKPSIRDAGDNKYGSADSMLRDKTEEKEIRNNGFIKKLMKMSIEKQSC